MSNEGERISQIPSVQPEVLKLPQIPTFSIGLRVLLLDKFQGDGYESEVVLRNERNPEIEDFWNIDHFIDSENTPIISLYNNNLKRRLQCLIFGDSYRIIKELIITRDSKKEIILEYLQKDKNGNWLRLSLDQSPNDQQL